MFFTKRIKIANAIFRQLNAQFVDLEQVIGPLPVRIASDEYVLGYLTGNVLYLTQRIEGNLSGKDKMHVLSVVIEGIFGRNAPSRTSLATLIDRREDSPEFIRGTKAAYAIRGAWDGASSDSPAIDAAVASTIFRTFDRVVASI